MSAKKTLTKIAQEKADDKAIAQELIEKIEGMVKDCDSKCKSAKEQLIESLRITADKYKTATGTMEALRTMRSVYPENYWLYLVEDLFPEKVEEEGRYIYFEKEQKEAENFASFMAAEAEDMAKKAESLDYDKMDQLCEGFYVEDYAKKGDELALELMRLDLCRNVGPAAEDMVEFYKRATQEIEDTQAELAKLIEKHPEFAELKD